MSPLRSSGSAPIKPKHLSPEQFTGMPEEAARAGLPLTGKGANKPPPDCAAGLPRTALALPFAAVGAKSLMVCSAGELTGKGKGPDCDDDVCG